jgi:tetratricopeptide (TPR) repeat protein
MPAPPVHARTTALCVLALCVAGLAAGRWGRLQHPAPEALRGQEVLLIPPGRVIRQLDLGYHSLAADLMFVRANLYYGHHLLTDEHLPWLDTFVDEVIATDPGFAKIYLWGALTSVFRRRINTELVLPWVQRANQILERGMRQFPEDHRFPLRLGSNFLYELGDHESAIPYFERAAGLPGAPGWLRERLTDLYSRQGQRELAARLVQELAMETDDPAMGRAIRDRMAGLLDPAARRRLETAREQLLEGWRQGFEHLPLDLYLLIREEEAW